MSNDGIDSSNNICFKKNNHFKLDALDKFSKSQVFNFSINKIIAEKLDLIPKKKNQIAEEQE
jgi:hypothetical protein